MADNGFEITGLDEFKTHIKIVANEFPGTCEKHLKRVGNKFKKELKKASPDSGKDHKNKLSESWTSDVQGYTGEDLQMNIWSNSPHFHLVDRGHVQKTKSGKVVGFVQGKHFLEKTAQKIESDVLPKEMEKLYKDISKKLGD
jgi:hypothetical protein